ncbi:recombinase family protein [Nocardia salmonicida]|uniref:recombinase family protein n=1 Tax=Nocardia salmonicida TaxID=53431 RepID=UPI0037B11D2C
MSRAYGWQTDGRTVDPAEANEIRSWADRLLHGDDDAEVSQRDLTRDLKARGVSTVSGKEWRAQVIRRALTAPRMIGKRFDDAGVLVDSDVEPILDVQTWDRLRAKLLDPERQKFAPTKGRINLLSRARAICAVCGGTLSYNGTGDGATVSCSLRGGGCGKVSILARLLDADTTERVLARLTDPAYRRKLAKAVAKALKGADPDAVVDEVRERLAVLGTDYADGKIERETMHAGTERARDRLARAERMAGVGELVDELDSPTVDDILNWWENTTDERRRDVVALLLDHVTVRTSEGQTVMGADRLDYTWHAV